MPQRTTEDGHQMADLEGGPRDPGSSSDGCDPSDHCCKVSCLDLSVEGEYKQLEGDWTERDLDRLLETQPSDSLRVLVMCANSLNRDRSPYTFSISAVHDYFLKCPHRAEFTIGDRCQSGPIEALHRSTTRVVNYRQFLKLSGQIPDSTE